ncbi:hypothetical protein BC831DRAFT_59253 [Entophlyctis helioformis]|nr:hypothetical protein BC831DRAFT_59253 [Entophlyctis helioformis]
MLPRHESVAANDAQVSDKHRSDATPALPTHFRPLSAPADLQVARVQQAADVQLNPDAPCSRPRSILKKRVHGAVPPPSAQAELGSRTTGLGLDSRVATPSSQTGQQKRHRRSPLLPLFDSSNWPSRSVSASSSSASGYASAFRKNPSMHFDIGVYRHFRHLNPPQQSRPSTSPSLRKPLALPMLVSSPSVSSPTQEQPPKSVRRLSFRDPIGGASSTSVRTKPRPGSVASSFVTASPPSDWFASLETVAGKSGATSDRASRLQTKTRPKTSPYYLKTPLALSSSGGQARSPFGKPLDQANNAPLSRGLSTVFEATSDEESLSSNGQSQMHDGSDRYWGDAFIDMDSDGSSSGDMESIAEHSQYHRRVSLSLPSQTSDEASARVAPILDPPQGGHGFGDMNMYGYPAHQEHGVWIDSTLWPYPFVDTDGYQASLIGPAIHNWQEMPGMWQTTWQDGWPVHPVMLMTPYGHESHAVFPYAPTEATDLVPFTPAAPPTQAPPPIKPRRSAVSAIRSKSGVGGLIPPAIPQTAYVPQKLLRKRKQVAAIETLTRKPMGEYRRLYWGQPQSRGQAAAVDSIWTNASGMRLLPMDEWEDSQAFHQYTKESS